MKTYQGKLQAKGLKIAIILSRFNQFISERLLEGALDALHKMGADEKDLSIYKVPGSFEIPFVAKKLARAKTFDGIVCLGVLIRGDTPHFDFLSAEVTKGLAQISMEDGLPVIIAPFDSKLENAPSLHLPAFVLRLRARR